MHLSAALALAVAVQAHEVTVNNPILGVPGFPDCQRLHPADELTVDAAAHDLRCHQRAASKDSVKVACARARAATVRGSVAGVGILMSRGRRVAAKEILYGPQTRGGVG